MNTSSPGLLTITAQSETLPIPGGTVTNTPANATLYIGKVIPHQVIVWRGYRVEMDSAADSLA